LDNKLSLDVFFVVPQSSYLCQRAVSPKKYFCGNFFLNKRKLFRDFFWGRALRQSVVVGGFSKKYLI
jgi:hypothetical protein